MLGLDWSGKVWERLRETDVGVRHFWSEICLSRFLAVRPWAVDLQATVVSFVQWDRHFFLWARARNTVWTTFSTYLTLSRCSRNGCQCCSYSPFFFCPCCSGERSRGSFLNCASFLTFSISGNLVLDRLVVSLGSLWVRGVTCLKPE